MQNQDKKLDLLRNRIQSDLNVEPESADDLLKYFLSNLSPSYPSHLVLSPNL